jgi:tripeptidyl-peptidase-1
MMHFVHFAVVGALAVGVTGVPFPAKNVVHERRDHMPKAWVRRDRLDSAAGLPVRIGLTQQNLDKGYDLLMEVYVITSTNEKGGISTDTLSSVHSTILPSTVNITLQKKSLISSLHHNLQWMQFGTGLCLLALERKRSPSL